MNYLLMNKNKPLLLFECGKNEFEETECTELEWFDSYRPLGFHNLTDYLASRQAPKHRLHIEELLRRYGCDDLEGFLNVTHALSLNDTLWVKQEASGLKWEDVSLYRNEFDELVSMAAFDGRFSSTSLSSTSPEFGTDGSYAKCWVREGSDITLYKSGSALFEIEPLSEYLSGQVAELLHLNFVSYDLAYYHNRLISKCRLFTDETTGLVKAHDVLPEHGRSVSATLKYFTSVGSEDEYRRMCVFDALILNTDRHTGNFGVLVNNDTMEIKKMAPVYDNNKSLLYDMDINQLTDKTEWCVGTCKPKFGTDFISTAWGMLTEEIRADLLTFKDFEFRPHPEIQTDEKRLEILSSIVRNQAARILGSKSRF